MKNIFDLPKFSFEELKLLSPQILAFVGDSVYSLYIRHKLISEKDTKIKDLHSSTTNYVKAKGQSLFLDNIYKSLTDEELQIFKRGRNFKTSNIAKNSTVADYKKATGLECLIGYLYLAENFERLKDILKKCVGEI